MIHSSMHAIVLTGTLFLMNLGDRPAHAQYVYQAPAPVYVQAPRTVVQVPRRPFRPGARSYYAPSRTAVTNAAPVYRRPRFVGIANEAALYNWPNASPVMIAKPWLNP